MKPLKILIALTVVASCVICMIGVQRLDNSCSGIAVYPFLYGIFIMVILPMLRKNRRVGSYTVAIIMMLQWLRLVFMPAIGCLSDHYVAALHTVSEDMMVLATVLTIYEAVVVFFVCIMILKYGKKRKTQLQRLTLRGDQRVYIAFALFALTLSLVLDINPYSFLRFEANSTRVALTNDVGSVVEAIISNGLTFFLLVVLYWFYKKYSQTNQLRYVYMALGCALFRICLISSESRLAIVYLLGTFVLLLPQMFPAKKQMIIRNIILAAGVVIGFLTVYKVFHAFLYDSYEDAIRANIGDFDFNSIAAQIDVYFYGTRTVARALNFVVTENPELYTPFVDLIRNTFGLHYLVGDKWITTTEAYNLFLYGGTARSGHLLASSAYGFAYVGGFMAPLATVVNVWIALCFERMLSKIRSVEWYYFVSVGFVRFAVTVFAGFGPSWNIISRTLVIGFVVIGGATLLKGRKKA